MGSRCTLMLLPRCGAYARSSGRPCLQPAMANGRCHFHGGKSKKKHGQFTKQAVKKRQNARKVITDLRAAQKTMEDIANA